MSLGTNIKKYRTAAGMTQEALAGLVGVSAQAVSKWENGDTMPDTALILPISDALSVSTDALLGKTARYKRDVYASLGTLSRQRDENESMNSLVWEMLWETYQHTLWGSVWSDVPDYDPGYLRENCTGCATEYLRGGFNRDNCFLRISHDEHVPFFFFFPGELFGRNSDWTNAVTPHAEVAAVFSALADPDTVRAIRWLSGKTDDHLFEFPVLTRALDLSDEAADAVRANLRMFRLITEEHVAIDGTTRTLCRYNNRYGYGLIALLAIAYEFCHGTKEYRCQSLGDESPLIPEKPDATAEPCKGICNADSWNQGEVG